MQGNGLDSPTTLHSGRSEVPRFVRQRRRIYDTKSDIFSIYPSPYVMMCIYLLAFKIIDIITHMSYTIHLTRVARGEAIEVDVLRDLTAIKIFDDNISSR